MKILTDTSTLFSPSEGKEMGLTVFPLNVTVDGKTYTEFVDMFSVEYANIVRKGSIPMSSQPSVGTVLEAFEKDDDDLVVISMADGLSGTYQSMVGVKNSIENNDHIHVINSKTLCGPHRYMVKRALEMQKNGATLEEVLKEVDRLCNSHKSFLIPQDFGFLKRGGRLTPLAATIGGLMRIVPVMTQTDDGRKLEKHSIARTMKKAVASIADHFKSMGVDGEGWLISVSHADCESDALKVVEQLKEIFPNTEVELLLLSPAFITQGGPDCIAVQVIKR